jgi:hypothetical protein
MTKKDRIIELYKQGVSEALIAKKVGATRGYVKIVVNGIHKRRYAWRRRMSRDIERMLAGAAPAERRMVRDQVAW